MYAVLSHDQSMLFGNSICLMIYLKVILVHFGIDCV